MSNVFAQAAGIIFGLGQLGQLYGAGDPQFSSTEYLAATVNSMSVGMVSSGINVTGMVGSQLTKGVPARELTQTGKVLRNAGKLTAASFALTALTVVEALELTTGFGPPYEGHDLEVGSQQCAKVHDLLGSALPDDSWRGSASHAYGDRTAEQRDRADTLADLDLELAALVKNQADMVTHMRLGFSLLKDLLLAAFFVECSLDFLPVPGLSKIFGISVFALGIGAASGMLLFLLGNSVQNGEQAAALTTEYLAVAKSALATGSLAPTELAVAMESTVSRASSSVASVANGPGDQRVSLGTVLGAGDTSADGAPGAPEVSVTPDETAPSTPAFTMPTLAQVTAMSGQAAKLSVRVSPHTSPVNQTMGQQGRGAPAPAKRAPAEEAALAADVEHVRAAAGLEGAQRAPIDDIRAGAVGAEEVQEPSPLDGFGWSR